MNINTAHAIIDYQNSRIRTLNGKRFKYNGFEYEIRYGGGQANFVALWRREVGKRNFKYSGGVGCYDCIGAASAFNKLKVIITNYDGSEIILY